MEQLKWYLWMYNVQCYICIYSSISDYYRNEQRKDRKENLLNPLAMSVTRLFSWRKQVRKLYEILNCGFGFIFLIYIFYFTLSDQVSSIENGLFMMETSGRGTLNTRQACGVESAAMRSGLSVHLLMFSSQLDLRDNTTCQLYMSNNNIKFYTVDVVALSENTPLGNS